MIGAAIKTAGGKWLLGWRVVGYVACLLVAAAVWVAPGWMLRGWRDAGKVAQARTELAQALQAVADRELARAEGDRRERAEDQAEANAIIRELESQVQRMEAVRASTSAQLRKALQRPVWCPAGGLPLADVVLPADAIGSLRDAGAGIPAPGPAASEPDH